MSRALSIKALQSVLLPESQSNLLILVTLTGGGLSTPIRLCDGYTGRLLETDDEIVYGVLCGLYAAYNITLITVANGGSGYAEGDLIVVLGTLLGGTASNNLRLTVKLVLVTGAITAVELAANPGKKVAAGVSVTGAATTTESVGSDGTGATISVVTKATQVVDDFIFMPLEIQLPTEQTDLMPSASLKLYDVTRIVLPKIRQLTGPPGVTLQIVLNDTPGILEADFTGLRLNQVDYNKDTILGKLVVEGLELEPFPCHLFLPSTFPGLF